MAVNLKLYMLNKNINLPTGIKPLMHEKIKSNKRFKKKTILGKANVFKKHRGVYWICLNCMFNERNRFPRTLTWWDLNSVLSRRLSAYSMSSRLRNSTTPSPSCCTSAKHTSPASRMWSFRSCQLPLGGRPAHGPKAFIILQSWCFVQESAANICVKPQVSLKVLYVSFWLF